VFPRSSLRAPMKSRGSPYPSDESSVCRVLGK
jgi:hypothetical protein